MAETIDLPGMVITGHRELVMIGVVVITDHLRGIKIVNTDHQGMVIVITGRLEKAIVTTDRLAETIGMVTTDTKKMARVVVEAQQVVLLELIVLPTVHLVAVAKTMTGLVS